MKLTGQQGDTMAIIRDPLRVHFGIQTCMQRLAVPDIWLALQWAAALAEDMLKSARQMVKDKALMQHMQTAGGGHGPLHCQLCHAVGCEFMTRCGAQDTA